MPFTSVLCVNCVIFGQGGTEGGKDGGKKKAKNAAGDSGGKTEVSC